MSHTATHLALGSKSEIQNAKSKLDYSFLIEKKQEEPRKKKKTKTKRKTTFIQKGKNQKHKKNVKLLSRIKPLSAYLYFTTFYDTAPNAHYSPRLSCFQETFKCRTVTPHHCLVVTFLNLFDNHTLLQVPQWRSRSSSV